MRTHKHHTVARSRGGSDDKWNLEEKNAYDHAYDHAVDFVLFDNAPCFDCRHEAWPLLPSDLQDAVKVRLSELMKKNRKTWTPSLERRRTQSERLRRDPIMKRPGVAEKVSLALTGKPKSKEHREKIIENLKARPPKSEETRAKLSKSLRGKPKSEEHKQKIAEASMGNQRWLGRKHSEETKRKMSESAKNRNKPLEDQ